MPAIVYRGPMAKSLYHLYTIFIHDFELYTFDRELSYDFVQVLDMLPCSEFHYLINVKLTHIVIFMEGTIRA